MLACTFAFAFAGLVAGLGEAVTIVFELTLLFEFSTVLQAAPKTAKANRVREPVVLRISVPPRRFASHVQFGAGLEYLQDMTPRDNACETSVLDHR